MYQIRMKPDPFKIYAFELKDRSLFISSEGGAGGQNVNLE
jgi:hypothetical protein